MLQKRKIIVLSITVLIIIGMTIFAVYYMLLSRDERQAVKQTKESESNITVQEIIKSVPRMDISYCEKYNHNENKKNYCILSIANSNNNSEYCERITSRDIENRCEESIIYNQIMSEGSIEKCSTLTYFKKQCYNDFFWKWDEISKCAEFESEFKNLCEDIINNKSAFTAGNSNYCGGIKDEILKLDCQKTAGNKPLDSDNDGMSDSREMSYGTNPFKEDTDNDGLSDLEELSKYFTDPKDDDTDGDGYSDGEEVKNGYNPKGEGILK